MIPEEEQASFRYISSLYENPLFAKTDIGAVAAVIKEESKLMSSVDWYGPMECGAKVCILLTMISQRSFAFYILVHHM